MKIAARETATTYQAGAMVLPVLSMSQMERRGAVPPKIVNARL